MPQKEQPRIFLSPKFLLPGLVGAGSALFALSGIVLIERIDWAAVFIALGIGALIFGIVPYKLLQKSRIKNPLPVVLLSYGVAIPCAIAVQSSNINSVTLKIIILMAVAGLYYLIATPLITRSTILLQYTFMVLGLAICYLASPYIIAFSENHAETAYANSLEDGMSNMPYAVYGPSSPEFKLLVAERLGVEKTAPAEIQLTYQTTSGATFSIQSLALPSTYNPPASCATTSENLLNYQAGPLACALAYPGGNLPNVYLVASNFKLYYIKQPGTLLIIDSRGAIPEDEMMSIATSLQPVTLTQMKNSRQGITSGAPTY